MELPSGLFKQGRIYCIRATNFVTYQEVLFFPNDYLNIIIGPNGTGKSTLVSAIVLGLGGSPKLLSRSTDLCDYVKHGEEEALIEIQLFKNETDVHSIVRIFNKSGIDRFTVDGQSIPQRSLMHLIRSKFNIQIDNLCQFLPQDRVQDFAKMNPQEVLKNTQISACEPLIADQFQKLIDMRQKEKNIGKDMHKKNTDLRELKAKNEALMPQIESMKERKKLMENVNIIRMKLAWMEHEQWLTKVEECKKDLREAKERLDNSEMKLKPRQKEAQHILNFKKAMDGKISKNLDIQSMRMAEVDKLEENLSVLDRELNKERTDLQTNIAAARDQDAELAVAKKVLLAYNQDAANQRGASGDENALHSEIEKLKTKIREVEHIKSGLVQKSEKINNERQHEVQYKINNNNNRIASLQNMEKKKYDLLSTNYESTHKATLWLNENHHIFKGRVYKPMLLELNLKDQNNAKFIENVVPLKDLIAFTFERKDDMNLFIREVRDKLQYQVNTVQSDPSNEILYNANLPISKIQHYGFHSYLIEMIVGPFSIINYLCKIYNIHQIPIGTDVTFECAGEVPAQIRQFFTPNHRFVINTSRYTGEKSTATFEIKPRNLLGATIDRNQIEKLQKELQVLQRKSDIMKTEIEKIEYKITQYGNEVESLKKTRRTYEDKWNNIRTSSEKAKIQETKYQRMLHSQIDVNTERKKFKKRNCQIYENRVEVIKKIAKQLELTKATIAKQQIIRQQVEIHQKLHCNVASEIALLEEEVEKAKKLFETIQKHCEVAEKECKSKKVAALSMTANKNPHSSDFPYDKKFKQLPKTIVKLTEAINDAQARIDCMTAGVQDIMDEYESRKKQIESLEAEINNVDLVQANLSKSITELHSKWFPVINEIINEINYTFQKLMKVMGFSGEIRLDKKNEHDYNEYGILIMVKYRNEEKLQALDRHVQSGGERAVAIAVYTLSLQHLSKVPFRCVDEINQGMDPRNERKVFDMLVQETCQVEKPQYFFVTPKLLPNLPYNDLMSVHVVHNGQFVGDPYIFCAEHISIED